MSNKLRLYPIFVGRTDVDMKIVLYKNEIFDNKVYIRIANGEVWSLSEGSKFKLSEDLVLGMTRIFIKSPEWTGQAMGSREELFDEDILITEVNHRT